MASKPQTKQKHENIRINSKRSDDRIELRDSRSYTGGNPKVIGVQNGGQTMERVSKPMIRQYTPESAKLENHKLITRERNGLIEVLLPEPTRLKPKRKFIYKHKSLVFTEETENKIRKQMIGISGDSEPKPGSVAPIKPEVV